MLQEANIMASQANPISKKWWTKRSKSLRRSSICQWALSRKPWLTKATLTLFHRRVVRIIVIKSLITSSPRMFRIPYLKMPHQQFQTTIMIPSKPMLRQSTQRIAKHPRPSKRRHRWEQSALTVCPQIKWLWRIARLRSRTNQRLASRHSLARLTNRRATCQEIIRKRTSSWSQ